MGIEQPVCTIIFVIDFPIFILAEKCVKYHITETEHTLG